jgi:hypothetical protein
MNWKDYEKEINDYFRTAYPKADISHNIKIIGRYSKVERQIDVLIEDYVAGHRMRIVVDGKFFSEKIDVKQVEMFIGMMNDCEVNKGLLITTEGYTYAAVNRAHYDPLDIDLDILNFKDLHEFQSIGGIPYNADFGVIVSPPFGWIIDGTTREGMSATFYQRGLTFQEAVNSLEWMYVIICSKDDNIKSLDDLTKLQRDYTLINHSDAKIDFLPTIKREGTNTRLRTIETRDYPTIEYTGFVEFEEFMFVCVLFTPAELKRKNIRKLEEVMLNAIPMKIFKPS